MKVFTESMDAIDDMKVGLLKNQIFRPFITSVDRAVLANRWHAESGKPQILSYDVRSAGTL